MERKGSMSGVLKALGVFMLGLSLLITSLPVVQAEDDFKFGLEMLLSDHKDLLEGKRVGLVTNPTGVDQDLNTTVDLLFEDSDIKLTALYGPEHGVRGNAEAGEYVEFYTDPETELPVYSLYGETRKPSSEMLKDVDLLVFDIQDAGVTYYTYVWTLYNIMEAASEEGKQVVVLDRPNPLGGDLVAGPVVVEEEHSSFVGLKDLALVHGMTFGELAQYFNGEFDLGVDLEVVEMQGYDRSESYAELDIPFVMPSPNMPTTDSIDVYPITGLFETFVNVSEGRGTTKPFQLVGSDFVNGKEYAQALNDLNLSGVKFRAAAFTPAPGQKLEGKLAEGVEVYVTDREEYDPLYTGLSMIHVLNNLYPDEIEWREDQWLAKLTGKSSIEEDLKAGQPVEEIIAKWDEKLLSFKSTREEYLIYPSGEE
ncbi:exo-beta-N-acetylmuramidase NamZ domain-containing protein [Ruoffia sp. FAM 26255]|uniref:exo-beta-N-acetylmuramidase NamZ family protein n=1 Tax=Ruoffia sp. FAM 26255 TaxID=3259519 RepID=UPI00388966B5